MNDPSSPTPLMLACPGCGAANRIPLARVADQPLCGRCGAELAAGRPLDVSEEQFDAVVQASPMPVLVDFWAPWCGPCRSMAPAFAQAARELAGEVLLLKVNSDEAPRLSQRYAIRSIPTLVRFEGGRETGRRSGALPASAIAALARG